MKGKSIRKAVVRRPGRMALKVVQKYFPEVKVVKDAKANVAIEVTKHDDFTAKRKAHKSCAMAVACKRKLNLDGVIISVSTAYMIKGNKAIRFIVPMHTAREVVSFDRGGGFATGDYILNRPNPNARLGAERDREQRPTGPHGKPPKRRHVLTAGIRTVLGSEVE